jgi:hypothetical protein
MITAAMLIFSTTKNVFSGKGLTLCRQYQPLLEENLNSLFKPKIELN